MPEISAEGTPHSAAKQHLSHEGRVSTGPRPWNQSKVKDVLYQRALGYEFDTVKVFRVNGEPLIAPYRAIARPDTTACIFWLKNRRSDRWRDVHKHEHGGREMLDHLFARHKSDGFTTVRWTREKVIAAGSLSKGAR